MKASDQLKSRTVDASSYLGLKQTIESTGGFVRAPWCGSQECEVKVKEETGSDIRLIPFDEHVESCVKMCCLRVYCNPDCIFCSRILA